MVNLTKAEVLALLKINQADLARLFRISRQSVCSWPDDKPLPRARALELIHEIHPELFAEQEKSVQEDKKEAA